MWQLAVPFLACLVGTCGQAMAAPSPPLPDSTVLAPYSVTRDAGDITVLTSNSWLLPQGSAVASFFGANGPAQIVQHNWNKLRAPRFDTVMVRHVPVERPADDSRLLHFLADKFYLTSIGQRELTWRAGFLAYSMQLACAAHGNCHPVCGGRGQCVPGCTQGKQTGHHCGACVVDSLSAGPSNKSPTARFVTS